MTTNIIAKKRANKRKLIKKIMNHVYLNTKQVGINESTYYFVLDNFEPLKLSNVEYDILKEIL